MSRKILRKEKDMHGAMVAEDAPDAEAYFLKRLEK